jgi:hypothetical protein
MRRPTVKDRIAEVALVVLEHLANCFGFGLAPIEDAEALAEVPIPYEV